MTLYPPLNGVLSSSLFIALPRDYNIWIIFNHLTQLSFYCHFSQFPFDGSQVRILVYRECDTRGRRLLFDSNALEKVYLSEQNSNKNVPSKGSNKTTTLSSIVGQHSQCQQQPHTTNLTSLNNNHKESSLSDRLKNASANKGHSNGNFIEVCDEYGYRVSYQNMQFKNSLNFLY